MRNKTMVEVVIRGRVEKNAYYDVRKPMHKLVHKPMLKPVHNRYIHRNRIERELYI